MSQYNAQHSYPGGVVNNTQSTMQSEAHKQYMASMRRRAPPPRFRPPMIIIMVLFGGLVFIGLVMTIIAVWPGYTPVGGNPLKIAGPILLALGGLGFIIGIVLICMRSQKEKKDFARSFYAASSQRNQLPFQPPPGHMATTRGSSDEEDDDVDGDDDEDDDSDTEKKNPADFYEAENRDVRFNENVVHYNKDIKYNHNVRTGETDL